MTQYHFDHCLNSLIDITTSRFASPPVDDSSILNFTSSAVICVSNACCKPKRIPSVVTYNLPSLERNNAHRVSLCITIPINFKLSIEVSVKILFGYSFTFFTAAVNSKGSRKSLPVYSTCAIVACLLDLFFSLSFAAASTCCTNFATCSVGLSLFFSPPEFNVIMHSDNKKIIKSRLYFIL